MPLSWSKSCSLKAVVTNIANECNVKVSYRKRHTGKFYTGTSEKGPHGVPSIASPVWEQVRDGAWMASDLTLELQQAVMLQERGLVPEPEVTVAENRIHDVSATPKADQPMAWEPVTEHGVIIRWTRHKRRRVGGWDPTSGVGVGGSNPTSASSGDTWREPGLQTSAHPEARPEPEAMPPVPTRRQQMPLVSSAEDVEARPRGRGWIQHDLVSD